MSLFSLYKLQKENNNEIVRQSPKDKVDYGTDRKKRSTRERRKKCYEVYDKNDSSDVQSTGRFSSGGCENSSGTKSAGDECAWNSKEKGSAPGDWL